MSTISVLSFAEFEQLPDIPGKRELIDGEVIELPPPKFTHSKVAKRVYQFLLEILPSDRVWQETGYRIGGGWLQPDVSVIWPDQQIEDDYLLRSPLLAVEVLSPRNTGPQIERKLTLYFAEGAAEVWVLDPRRKTFTAYVAVDDQVRRVAVNQPYNSAALGLTVSSSQFFD